MSTDRPRLYPLYAAGFVTAFGAHGIAASLGGQHTDLVVGLLTLGVLLAVYDGAEVLLKPVFGALADRIGPKPVLLGGLVAFALASAAFLLAPDPAMLGVARFAQGASAAAFSPAASAMVARLTPGRKGRAFGGYSSFKSLGYALGPLGGGVLIHVGGYPVLFGVLAVLAAGVAVAAAAAVPTVPPLPRQRQTVLDLLRRLGGRDFLAPTAALAAVTGALAVAVGFFPVVGARDGLGIVATGAVVSALSVATAVASPLAGRWLDSGRLPAGRGLVLGSLLVGAGITGAATVPGVAALVLGGVLIGIGVGVITPIGFTMLAESAPPERLGQTMGAAEVGRELGDAGGPLLVGGLAVAAGLTVSMNVFAAVVVLLGLLCAAALTRAQLLANRRTRR